MSMPKRKISVSLDEDLIRGLEAVGQSISSQINRAVRAELERRQRRVSLQQLLNRFDAEDGPVPEELVDKYTRMLE